MAELVTQTYRRRVAVDQLHEHPENPRRGDVAAIGASIAHDGFYGAVIVQESTGFVLAGNHRLRAARAEGLTHLPALVLDVDDDMARRILLVDNRTADLASWDNEALATLLGELAITPDALAGTAFTMDDLAALLTPPEPEADPPIPEAPAVARSVSGDVYQLGRHRLICGDCRDAEVVTRLLEGAAVNVAFTSPPYADRRDYDPDSGFRPIPPDEYVEWFAPVAERVAEHLAPDGSWFVNIKPPGEGLDTDLYVLDLVAAHVRRWGWHFATELCWERNGIPKNVTLRFKNQFEPIYQFTRGRWKVRPDHVAHHSDHAILSLGPGSGNTGWADRQGSGRNLIDAARRPRRSTLTPGALANFQGDPAEGARIRNARRRKHGTDQMMSSRQGTNAAPGEWTGEGMAYPGNRLPTFAADHEATGHAAAFPVGLPEWFIKAYTDPDDVVYEPFAGSGSTILAAERVGRVAYGVEISPRYVDVICTRWQRHTQVLPVNVATGEPVDFGGTDADG